MRPRLPGRGRSRIGIGNVQLYMGKHEEALVQYQQALKVFEPFMARSNRTWHGRVFICKAPGSSPLRYESARAD